MPKGLTTPEVEKLRERCGQNVISVKEKHSKIDLFINQLKSPIVLILLASSLITLFLAIYNNDSAELVDTVMIFVIVLLSALFGYIQDNKAENTIEALKLHANPSTDVYRDGAWKLVSAVSLVPGDYIRLAVGDVVPADCELVSANEVFVSEAALTGESKEVHKRVSEKIFAGTTVSQGIAEAVVENIGLKTEIGKIADELTRIDDANEPFDLEISNLTKKISKFILGVLVVVFLINLKHFGIEKAFLVAVTLAVAAIPEGLPALVTLTLGIGAYDMSKNNVLIRRMSSIESIGKISHICVDKTGTLTRNEMSVVDLESIPDEVIETAALLTEAKKILSDGEWLVKGSPIDRAMYLAAEKKDIDIEDLKSKLDTIKLIPFTTKTKCGSLTYKEDGRVMTVIKGAPEIVLDRCSLDQNGDDLDSDKRADLLNEIRKNSEKGYYLIGLAKGESKLKWLSLLVFEDPLKDGISKAILECETAGIRVSMLTGDMHTTALNVAKEINLKTKGYISGKDLDNLDHETLTNKVREGVNVFSRVLPLHKLKVLRLFQEDEVVAMTGDGVNDSLALKQAEIGVSMGKYGTEAAKQASDMVLLDDNFSSIVKAVKEGRRIRENIKKFINYLFVSNLAEILVILLIPLIYKTEDLILLPAQILWINLLTDGLPALALGTDPANPNIMKEQPVVKSEPLIDKKLGLTILVIGVKKSLMLISIFFINLHFFGFDVARTALFTSFVFYEFVRIVVIRRQESLNFFSNKLLIYSLLVSITMQLLLVYTPLAGFFGAVSLGLYPMLIILGGTVIGYLLAITLTSIMATIDEQSAKKAF